MLMEEFFFTNICNQVREMLNGNINLSNYFNYLEKQLLGDVIIFQVKLNHQIYAFQNLK